MTKIDHRISYRIVLDTEACPIDRTFAGVDPSNMWVYDIGWAVVDKRGTVYATRSFVIADIFLAESEAMHSAYYAAKIPLYWQDIKDGSRVLTTYAKARKALLADIETYGVTEIYCHNARFDYGTLNQTERWLTKSKFRYFFPYGVTVCDTLKMARDTIAKMPTYRKFCECNGYLTKSGQCKLTAEVIYRFITGDTDFSEEHTGLADVLIEKEIMAYCFRQHKKMRRALFGA